MQSSDHNVSVGLVYQAAAVNQHLKQALAELGAHVVYDAPASSFDFGALDASGAEVVIVNLDPEVEEFDALGDLLADERRRVVINDGEVSSKLSGWDQARWARHLAAKVLGAGDLNPPRPAGAQAIPVVSKPAAPEYPGAPADAQGFDIAADEIERALAADTSHAFAATKAELVTVHEPAPISLQDRDESLREAGHEVGFDVSIELDATPVEREVPSASGFSMLEEPKTATDPIQEAADEFADFGDFGGLLLETSPEAPAAETPAPQPAAQLQPVSTADDLDFGGFSLEAVTEEPAPDVKPAKPAATALDDFDLGRLSLEPEAVEDESEAKPEPAATAAAPKPAPVLKQAAAPALDHFDLGGISLEPLAEPEPEANPDARLASLQKTAARAAPTVEIPLAELQKAQRQSAPTVQIPVAELQKAQQAAKPASAPAPADDFDLGGFSLEPLTEEPAAAPAPAAASDAKPVPKSPAPAAPSSEWDSIGAFSLEPLEEPEAADAAKPTAAAPPPAPKPAPAPAPAPASKPAPAPVAAKPTAPVENNAALAGLDLEFAEAGDNFKFSDFGSTAEPVAEVENDDELMKQFQAILDGEEYTPPLETGPIQRVWVLGASIGGPEAVREFLSALPPGLPVLFLLAQHMGSDFVDLMTQQLSRATKYKVRHVADGDVVAHGEVVVVPLAERLRVLPSGESQVSALEQVSSYTPSIDTVLKDAADAFGKNAGAIIFSGMAHDAIEGAKYLHSKGGVVWAQDPKTCVVSSMVDGAVNAGVVAQKAGPAELAAKFAAMFAGK